MQESSLATLRSRKLKFTSAQPMRFITNYYSIEIDKKKSMIYQYSYSVVPEIQNDSSRKLQNIIRNIWKELINKIGLISVRGNNLYGNIDFKGQTTHLSKIKQDDKEIVYEVLIKKIKDLPLSQMVFSSKAQESFIAMQVINIDTKQRLRRMNMIQLDQGKYYAKQKIVNENFEAGFFVLQGYSFTAEKLKIGLSLHVQIFSRLIRQSNVLEEMNYLKTKDDIKANLAGAIVITRYGNFRTYKVIDVDFLKSPLSTFIPKNQNKQISYIDYYKHNYDVTINITNQPLLHIITKIQKVKRKGDKTQKVIHQGYLIPELVSLVGLSNQHRGSGFLMKQISLKTQIDVEKRVKETEAKIQLLNNQQGLYKIGDVVKVDGYLLDQPAIQTKRNFKAQNGLFKLLKDEQVNQPAQIYNCLFFVHKNYVTEARQLEKALQTACSAFKITMKKSEVIYLKGLEAHQWINNIESQFMYIKNNKLQMPKIVVIVLSGIHHENVYQQIKNLCTIKYQICTQFAHVSKIVTMNKRNQLLSYASNIILQMNAKMGKTIWQVPVNNPHLTKKTLMIGAMAISKNGNHYSLGFVGTTNPKLSKVYSETKIQKKRNQFNVSTLAPIFTNWLRTYYVLNNKIGLPEIIVFYREGLTPTQAQKNVKLEVEALETAIKQAKARTKVNNYNPQIVYLSVNKRSSTRFYQRLGNPTSQQKFAPKYVNPLSGSVIVDSLCAQNITGFNLAATCPNSECTASPSQFILHYHSPKRTPEQAFIQLSFQQCFNYYNWRGAIKSPACLQNADRLAKLAGKSLKSDVSIQNELSKVHHFL